MSYRRHAGGGKRDFAERPIVQALRAHGFSVLHIKVKDGPDLVLGKDCITRVAESKTGKAHLREGQTDWWRLWRGNPLIVLREVNQVAVLAANWRRLDTLVSRG